MTEMINVQVDAKQIVLDWMGSNAFIPTNKKLLRQIGDTNTILLAESINQYKRWAQKGKLEKDGSFYWTQLDCEIETGYSRSTQTRAFKDMQKRGLLKTESRKVLRDGEEKSIRFITLNFTKIAELMFSDDSAIIEAIEKKYADLKKQNQKSKQKTKEKSMIQNESSLEPHGMIQNESSEGGFKMNHPDDSKWITSNKDLFIKKDLEEEEEAHSELVQFLLEKQISLEGALEFEQALLKRELVGYTNDDVILAFKRAYQDFKKNPEVGNLYALAAYKLNVILDSKRAGLDQAEKGKKQEKKSSNSKKPIRTEKLPDWFDEEEEQQQETSAPEQTKEEKRQEIEDMLKKLRD